VTSLLDIHEKVEYLVACDSGKFKDVRLDLLCDKEGKGTLRDELKRQVKRLHER
jgi:hypothetical protein